MIIIVIWVLGRESMRWVIRGMSLLVGIAILTLGRDNAYSAWSAAFLLAAWVMLEPRLRPVLILLPVAGLTGIVALLWQQPWL